MAQPPDQMPAAAGRGHLRTSRAEREHAIEMLKAAYVHGMLTKDELDARLGQALTSRTHADLAALTADISAQPAAAGPARPPARVRRRPLARAAAGSGGCLAIAFAAVWFAANVLDPHGLGNPYHPWSSLCAVVALAAMVTAFAILANGVATSLEQRRSRRQLPPRPRGHSLDGERHGGPSRGPIPPRPSPGTGTTRANLRANQSRTKLAQLGY